MAHSSVTQLADTTPTRRGSTRRLVVMVAVMALSLFVMSACGSGSSSSDPTTTAAGNGSGSKGEKFPDVLQVKVEKGSAKGSYDIAVTLSSPYDSAERYADAWRVLDPSGKVLGVRELGHDHADEQPFTRNETVKIPDAVDKVTVQGRDQVSGYGGKQVTAEVPR